MLQAQNMVGNNATSTACPNQYEIVEDVQRLSDLLRPSMTVVRARTCRLLLTVNEAKSSRLVLADEDPKTGWTLRAIAGSEIVAKNEIPTMDDLNVGLLPDRNDNGRLISDLVALSGLPRRSEKNYNIFCYSVVLVVLSGSTKPFELSYMSNY
ncbi:uncharacterized protein LOC134215137 isoform X2 [Armigeres subalbatus]|uniref:uncharacterized protein LOC134215137 isoform X2 n=1 Tax=Armigeres subalbatus TaxID=124917 RepID=UPI002ED51BF4